MREWNNIKKRVELYNGSHTQQVGVYDWKQDLLTCMDSDITTKNGMLTWFPGNPAHLPTRCTPHMKR